MKRKTEVELEDLEEIRMDLREFRKDLSVMRKCVEKIRAWITEGKIGKREEREAGGGLEKCKRESGEAAKEGDDRAKAEGGEVERSWIKEWGEYGDK